MELYIDGIAFVHSPDQDSPDRKEECMGIACVAYLGMRTAPGGWQDIGKIYSAGLWGIECSSDSDYVAEIEQEQFVEVVELLERLGFTDSDAHKARLATIEGESRSAKDKRFFSFT